MLKTKVELYNYYMNRRSLLRSIGEITVLVFSQIIDIRKMLQFYSFKHLNLFLSSSYSRSSFPPPPPNQKKEGNWYNLKYSVVFYHFFSLWRRAHTKDILYLIYNPILVSKYTY